MVGMEPAMVLGGRGRGKVELGVGASMVGRRQMEGPEELVVVVGLVEVVEAGRGV